MGNANAINWFEIPAANIKRAKSFYETIFDFKMGDVADMMGMQMVYFPVTPQSGKVGGSLVQSQMHTPSLYGNVIYLNANESGLDNILERIPAAGGRVTMPRTKISDEVGDMAFFVDSEGNKIGLHTSK